MDHRNFRNIVAINFLGLGASPNQRSSSVWIDRSKEYDTSSDPWSHVHSTDKGIIQSMMIGEAPWEDHHHRSRLSDDLNNPSVFYFLSNTLNMMNSEDGYYLMSTSLKNETRSHDDSSFTVSASLKNETNTFPGRIFHNISEVNLHSNHHVECNEAWGACTLICIIMVGACKLIMSSVTAGLKLVKK